MHGNVKHQFFLIKYVKKDDSFNVFEKMLRLAIHAIHVHSNMCLRLPPNKVHSVNKDHFAAYFHCFNRSKKPPNKDH
jgi:cytochrome c